MLFKEPKARLADLRQVRVSPYRPAAIRSRATGLIHDRLRSRAEAVRKPLARTGASIHEKRPRLLICPAHSSLLFTKRGNHEPGLSRSLFQHPRENNSPVRSVIMASHKCENGNWWSWIILLPPVPMDHHSMRLQRRSNRQLRRKWNPGLPSTYNGSPRARFRQFARAAAIRNVIENVRTEDQQRCDHSVPHGGRRHAAARWRFGG